MALRKLFKRFVWSGFFNPLLGIAIFGLIVTVLAAVS